MKGVRQRATESICVDQQENRTHQPACGQIGSHNLLRGAIDFAVDIGPRESFSIDMGTVAQIHDDALASHTPSVAEEHSALRRIAHCQRIVWNVSGDDRPGS